MSFTERFASQLELRHKTTYESNLFVDADAAYLKKFSLMREFGHYHGLIDDTQANSPKFCNFDTDREGYRGAMSKLEIIKLWYRQTLMPMRHMYAWAVPSLEALEMIQRTVDENGLQGVIEIGAGTGYWAMQLQRRGIDVVAFDKDIGGSNMDWTCTFVSKPVPFHDVFCGGPEILQRCGYKSRACFLCYPHPGNEMCTDALKNFEGDFLVYVGALDWWHQVSAELVECARPLPVNGVKTGRPSFFMELYKNWEVLDQTALPCHFFCHDHLVVLRRRSAQRTLLRKPESEAHERLIPKWKALSAEDAAKHVREVELENWKRFDTEWRKYAEVHGIVSNLEIPYDAIAESAIGPFTKTLGMLKSERELQRHLNSECRNTDPSRPWKECLSRMIAKCPETTSEKFHEHLVSVYPDLTKKEVKNMRRRILKHLKPNPGGGDNE